MQQKLLGVVRVFKWSCCCCCFAGSFFVCGGGGEGGGTPQNKLYRGFLATLAVTMAHSATTTQLLYLYLSIVRRFHSTARKAHQYIISHYILYYFTGVSHCIMVCACVEGGRGGGHCETVCCLAFRDWEGKKISLGSLQITMDKVRENAS